MPRWDVAFIVPFRRQRECDRDRQLATLLPHLTRVPRSVTVVVTQAEDGRRFNRGQLLNWGWIACRERGGARAVCCHDVDLIPASELALREYATLPVSGVVRHLAFRSTRYGGRGYLGGVTMLHADDFVRCNGFPNCFFGWGGEDDALRRRGTRIGLRVRPVACGLRDAEVDARGRPLDWEAKNAQLRCAAAKCPDKRERVAADAFAWTRDGVNTLDATGTRPTVRDDGAVLRLTVSLADGDTAHPLSAPRSRAAERGARHSQVLVCRGR